MSLRLGRPFGIPLYIHWTFWLLPLVVLYKQPAEHPFSIPVILAFVLLTAFCIVLHEYGHALMARYFGIGTQDITLYPIGGVARLTKMPQKPLDEILIAIAGPAVNAVIAIVLAMGLVPLALINMDNLEASIAFQFALLLWGANVVLVLFNMLPAFPMDGGRVLRAVLSIWLGIYPATRIAVGIGMGMAALMAIAGVFGNLMLVVIAGFVVLAGQMELMGLRMHYRRVQMRNSPAPAQIVEAIPVNPAEREFMFQPTISVYTWDNHTETWRREPSPLT